MYFWLCFFIGLYFWLLIWSLIQLSSQLRSFVERDLFSRVHNLFTLILHLQKKMKVLWVTPRSSACRHRLVCLQRPLCWASKAAKQSPLWISTASRAKCFTPCWIRWSPKSTTAPPNKTRKAAREISSRRNPRSSWTLRLVSSAEISSSSPASMWRLSPTDHQQVFVGEFLVILSIYWLLLVFRMHLENWRLQGGNPNQERRWKPLWRILFTGTSRWRWPIAHEIAAWRCKPSQQALNYPRWLRLR